MSQQADNVISRDGAVGNVEQVSRRYNIQEYLYVPANESIGNKKGALQARSTLGPHSQERTVESQEDLYVPAGGSIGNSRPPETTVRYTQKYL